MDKARLRCKAILGAAFLLSLLLLPHAVMAEPLRAGWVLQEGSAPPTWIFGDNEAVIMLSTNEPDGQFDASALMQKFDVPELCPGISKMALSAADPDNVRIARMSSGTFDCAIGSRTGTQSSVTFVVLQISGSKADAINYAKTMVRLPRDEAKEKERPAAQSAKVTPTAANDTTLQSATASIPASNRPIDMVLISEWNSVAMSMTYNPRIVFANGYAVDECRGWDMSKIAPTPSALAAIGSDCKVERWKKVAGSYVFQDKDGDWSEAGEAGHITGFRKGQRIDIDKSYVGGGGQAANLPGASGSSYLSSGMLKMTASGSIAIGDWFSNSIYTRNVQAVGSGGSSVEGQYYLDGYIIAVQASDGSISFGTIGKKQEEKLYVYLNGEMYWDS